MDFSLVSLPLEVNQNIWIHLANSVFIMEELPFDDGEL